MIIFTMRKMIIAGNWKMNKTISEAVELARAIKQSEKVEVIIAPTFIALDRVNCELHYSTIMLAAQNMYFEDQGPYTGEVSPFMLKDAGCTHVILGHSERRHLLCESNELINTKVKCALKDDLKVILCIGETGEERNSGRTNEILECQLKTDLKDVTDLNNVIIAYEPVWAISGQDPNHKPATPEDAESAHQFIRSKICEMYGEETAKNLRILYGGSVKPDNAESLLSLEDVDGALVGGASLKPETFNPLIDVAEKYSQ